MTYTKQRLVSRIAGMGRKRKESNPLMTAAELTRLRKSYFKLPQTEMCKKLGVGIRAYSAYETGETAIPDPIALLVRCLKNAK
jgi:DNA-binding transcriptional regulator YiaG